MYAPCAQEHEEARQKRLADEEDEKKKRAAAAKLMGALANKLPWPRDSLEHNTQYTKHIIMYF